MFRGAEHGDHFHDAAEVDGEPGYAARHLVAVRQLGTVEEVGEEAVELFLLLLRQPQGEDAVHQDAFQLLLPLFAPGGEALFKVAVVVVELVLPLLYGGHVVEQLPREEPVFGVGNQGRHLRGSARNQYGEERFLYFAAPVRSTTSS